MSEYLIQDSTLTNIANSIRSKTGKSEPILTENMANEIDSITGGGGGTLAIKTGTFVGSGYSGIDIPHGCGKLPLAVWTEIPQEVYENARNQTMGFSWIRGGVCVVAKNNINMQVDIQRPYIQGQVPPGNSIVVDDTNISLAPPDLWYPTTYTWYAVYEV